MECCVCAEKGTTTSFPTCAWLHNHIAELHGLRDLYSCVDCHYGFPSEHSLLLHISYGCGYRSLTGEDISRVAAKLKLYKLMEKSINSLVEKVERLLDQESQKSSENNSEDCDSPSISHKESESKNKISSEPSTQEISVENKNAKLKSCELYTGTLADSFIVLKVRDAYVRDDIRARLLRRVTPRVSITQGNKIADIQRFLKHTAKNNRNRITNSISSKLAAETLSRIDDAHVLHITETNSKLFSAKNAKLKLVAKVGFGEQEKMHIPLQFDRSKHDCFLNELYQSVKWADDHHFQTLIIIQNSQVQDPVWQHLRENSLQIEGPFTESLLKTLICEGSLMAGYAILIQFDPANEGPMFTIASVTNRPLVLIDERNNEDRNIAEIMDKCFSSSTTTHERRKIAAALSCLINCSSIIVADNYLFTFKDGCATLTPDRNEFYLQIDGFPEDDKYAEDYEKISPILSSWNEPKMCVLEYEWYMKFANEMSETIFGSCRLWSETFERMGALVLIQHSQDATLDSCISKATIIDSHFSRELLLTLFNKNSPLHDLCVVVRLWEDRLPTICCAKMMVPLKAQYLQDIGDLSSKGSRHRAAAVLSYIAKTSLVLVVSEETGRISIARNGQLSEYMTKTVMFEIMREHFLSMEESSNDSIIPSFVEPTICVLDYEWYKWFQNDLLDVLENYVCVLDGDPATAIVLIQHVADHELDSFLKESKEISSINKRFEEFLLSSTIRENAQFHDSFIVIRLCANRGPFICCTGRIEQELRKRDIHSKLDTRRDVAIALSRMAKMSAVLITEKREISIAVKGQHIEGCRDRISHILRNDHFKVSPRSEGEARFKEFDHLIQDIRKDSLDIQTLGVPESMSGDSAEKHFANSSSQLSFNNETPKAVMRILPLQSPETSKSAIDAISDRRSRLLELEIQLKERKQYKIELEIQEIEQRMEIPHRNIGTVNYEQL